VRRGAGRGCSVLGVLLLASACSSTGGPGATATADAATSDIEGVLAAEIGLGPLVAFCERPPPDDQRVPFECTAETEDGQVIRFTGQLSDDGEVTVESINLLSNAGRERLAEEAAQALADQTGTELTAGSLTCPDGPAQVIEAGLTVECELTNPRTGAVDLAVITLTDPTTMAFDVELGEVLSPVPN
jgi:hypothetical protein